MVDSSSMRCSSRAVRGNCSGLGLDACIMRINYAGSSRMGVLSLQSQLLGKVDGWQ
jgi:hypothetical protein